MLKATKLNESGYDESILGFGMAMKPRSARLDGWWSNDRRKQVERTAEINAHRDGGHNKFLRGIMTWWHLDMPRFMSQEFATYKIGTVSLSASTMHRITYEPATMDCFDGIDVLDYRDMEALTVIVEAVNRAVERKDLLTAKRLLPESYMLEQVFVCSYAVLREIIKQRHDHRLAGWQEFIASVMNQVDHPELLMVGGETMK